MPGRSISASVSRRALLQFLALCTAWRTTQRRVAAQEPAFRFLVVNDLHHATPECDPFFRSLVAQMGSHGAIDFCLIVGDIADTGKPESFAAIRDTFAALRVPIYTVPGNHDNDVEKTTRLYSEAFPGRLNYAFAHKGWQFVALDSTDENKFEQTRIGDAALAWLEATVPTLDRTRPTVVFTHFPLATGVNLVPLNALDVLKRLSVLNVRAAFTGHYHARVERWFVDTRLITNACCSRMRDNHDGSLEEGYLVCTARTDGRLTTEFVEFAAARKKA